MIFSTPNHSLSIICYPLNKLVHFIVHSKAAAYIAALLYIGVWCRQSVSTGGISLLGCLGLLLSLVMGYLSVRVAREYSFNNGKNALPATFFFMGCAIAPQVNPARGDGLYFILLAVAVYILLRTYRSRSAMGGYFLAFALVGVLCLMAPSLLLTLPWLILCGAFMESLHMRTFFAALWGLLFPYWMVVGLLFLTDRIGLISTCFAQLLPSEVGLSGALASPQQWMQLLWISLLALPGSVMILFNRTMRLQASAGYRVLITSLVILFITICIFPTCYSALFPCVLLLSSLIGTHLFVGNGGRAKNIYLIVLLILLLLILGQDVWSNYMMR